MASVTPKEVAELAKGLIREYNALQKKFNRAHEDGTGRGQVLVHCARAVAATLLLDVEAQCVQRLSDTHDEDLLSWVAEIAEAFIKAADADNAVGGATQPKATA